MNFSKNNYLSKKNAVLFFSTILLSALLLSSQTNVNYLTTIFFADISATISSDTTEVCKDDGTANITFEGSGGQAPYTFIYELNGDKNSLKSDTNTNSKTITLPSSSVGSFKYELIEVKDNADNSKVISGQIETININAPPTVDFSFNNNDACSGETIQFTNNSSGIGNLEYSWDFGDGTNIKNAENPNHIFDTLGCGTENFNIKLTVTDENGCSSSKTKEITVKQKPDIKFRNKENKTNFFSNCDGTSASDNFQITVQNISTSTCISSYKIDWDDGSEVDDMGSAFSEANHTYTEIGEYTIKITGVGSNGCENEVTYKVINDSNPAAGLLSLITL